MTVDEIIKKIEKIIIDSLGITESELVYESTFVNSRDPADYFDRVEIVVRIEQEFNINLPDFIYDEISMVKDVFDIFFKSLPREFLKQVETRIVCFRFRADGKIEALLKFEDGSWCYADGTTVLPSAICILAFNRWSNILKELEEIINNPNVKENDLQKYFETYPELLAGDDYDVVLPQAVIVNDDKSIWKSDFVLTPKNQYEFAKVLELKIPQVNIVNRPKSGHVTFSSKIWNAIQQVRDYSRAFDAKKTRERFKKEYNVDIFKPDLHIIAGKKWDIKIMDSLRQLQRETPVKIEDWNSALDRLKRNFT